MQSFANFHSGNPSGVVAEKNGIVIYHAGDTGYHSALFKDICKLYHPQIALLPIGGTFTMDIYGAALAVEDLGVSKVIPMHYNTFPLINADVEKFKELVKVEVVVMKVGEEWEV
ncbi:MBL fold metallo-hydrolase [Candidatus Woesearchaeota archaeon]|nr:MBL fold metallo-hydrolase [Candidatus Woesearchaeota archaeon]